MMRKVEDFLNRLTDMDWGWWPMLAFRPPKDRDIDNRVLLKVSPVFGSISGLLIFLIVSARYSPFITVWSLIACLLLGIVFFFTFYKFTFALFWNRRARRLRTLHVEESGIR
jgi:hypothetical protein